MLRNECGLWFVVCGDQEEALVCLRVPDDIDEMLRRCHHTGLY